eukprot:6186339-Pleurochrysis_carterae.AAC.7
MYQASRETHGHDGTDLSGNKTNLSACLCSSWFERGIENTGLGRAQQTNWAVAQGGSAWQFEGKRHIA